MGKFTFLILMLLICWFSRGNGCYFEEFDCGNGLCLDFSDVCNGIDDCKNSKDEELCGEGSVCGNYLFECESYRQCIPENWKCDGFADCLDRSDEKSCKGIIKERKACLFNEFMCASDKKCIPIVWKCDGVADCKDRSDEMHCYDACEKKECSQKCKTSSKGPRCYCNEGFELDKTDNKTCNDIDECLNKSICSQNCINTPGSYRCICYDGYEMVNETCIKFGIEDSEIILFNEGSNIYIKKRKAGYELLNSLPLSSRMGKITGLSFQPKTEVLYVADGEKPAIYAVNMSSLHVQVLVTNHLSSPQDIAFDWRSDNLYWVDADKGTTEVISADTLKRIVLIEELSNPTSLAISPNSGTMFIAEVRFEAWISMFDMDGTNKRILHSFQGLPMSLSLHPSETLLYWSDTRKEEISYVNYSSISLPRILKRVTAVMSVAVSEDRIFYTTGDLPLQSERRPAEKVHEMKLLEYRKDKNWKSITYNYGMKLSRMSECLIENGGCGYLCLTSSKGRTCACPTLMKLDTDERTCIGKLV